jgi:hypothetical protein
LAKVDDEFLEITFSENEVLIKGKRKRAGLTLQNEITLPINVLPKPKELVFNKVTSHEIRGLMLCGNLCNENSNQLYTKVVKWDNTSIESTDNQRLMHFTLKPSKCISTPILITPRAIGGLDRISPEEMALNDKWAVFKGAKDCLYYCRHTSGVQYPDLTKHFLKKGRKIVLPPETKDIISRADVLSSTNFESNSLLVSLETDKLTIRGEGDSGWYEESKKCKYSDESFEMFISPKIFNDVLSHEHTVLVNEKLIQIQTEDYVMLCCLATPNKGSK